MLDICIVIDDRTFIIDLNLLDNRKMLYPPGFMSYGIHSEETEIKIGAF